MLEHHGLAFFLAITVALTAACGASTTGPQHPAMAPDGTPDFDLLWDYQDPAATATKFQEILPEAEASGDVSYHLQLLTQVARTHSLRSQFDEAHALLDQVEGELGDAPPVVRVRYLLERGRSFNSAGDKAKATPLFLEAWELAQAETLDFHAVDAAHMLGIVSSPDEALAWSEKAMALAETSKHPRARKWLGALTNNIGWTYFDMGQHEKALEVLQKALAWREEQGEQGSILIARWSVARVLRAQGKLDQALAIQEEVQAAHDAAGTKDGYVYEELGELYLATGRLDEARHYFEAAHIEHSKDPWIVENQAEGLKRLKDAATPASPASVCEHMGPITSSDDMGACVGSMTDLAQRCGTESVVMLGCIQQAQNEQDAITCLEGCATFLEPPGRTAVKIGDATPEAVCSHMEEVTGESDPGNECALMLDDMATTCGHPVGSDMLTCLLGVTSEGQAEDCMAPCLRLFLQQ